MEGKRNPFVAKEGIPFLLVALIALVACWLYGYRPFMVVPAALLILFSLIFRDPRRVIPAVPLGVVSPVDGTVTEIKLTDKGSLGNEAHQIFIKVDSLGSYTARCPAVTLCPFVTRTRPLIGNCTSAAPVRRK